jgi:hypothetical protein
MYLSFLTFFYDVSTLEDEDTTLPRNVSIRLTFRGVIISQKNRILSYTKTTASKLA